MIGDEVEKVSWWTTNALSAKTKRLDGVKIPPNTREFIVGVQNWVLIRSDRSVIESTIRPPQSS